MTFAIWGRLVRTMTIAGCLFVTPYFTARAVSLDDILIMKERFKEVKAVKYTNEFKEHFERVMAPFELFNELYGKMVDAQTGRDPWKIEERPSWSDDPLGRLIKTQADGYEKVADSIIDLEMPSAMFEFETSLAAYPLFWKDWEKCGPKAAEALTNDLGKIEIMLATLSDTQEKFSSKANEVKDVRAVWDEILHYIDGAMTLPRLSEFDHVSYLFGKEQAIRHTIFGGSGNRDKILPSDRGLTRVEKALAIKSNELVEKVRDLRTIRASLTAALSRYQSKCIAKTAESLETAAPPSASNAAPSNSTSTITGVIGTDQLSSSLSTAIGRPSGPTAPSSLDALTRPTSGRQGIPKTVVVPGGTSHNSQSTITGREFGDGGAKANYQPITKDAAQTVMAKYKSIPGGVTLEGGTSDLAFVTSVRFMPQANAFILNDDVVYLNPISVEEFSQINDGLAKDDKLGVSLGQDGLVYGALVPDGSVAWKLKIADQFLGSIAYARRQYIADYKMAPGYDWTYEAENCAAYFNIYDVRFTGEASREINRSAIKMSLTVIPLLPSTGGIPPQPDFQRIALGNVAPKTAARLQHLANNFAYYGRERIIRRMLSYGEAAAFIRAMTANGIRLEMK